jgi:broad specificity phosphatase PhoE
MTPQRIYLIRHGQTEWNVTGRWQGSLEVDLNDHGREQAAHLAQRLADRPISHIFTSDLSRALETAQMLGTAVGVEPQPDPRWREMNLGVFQGLTKAEVLAQQGDEYRVYVADIFDHVIQKGESRRMLQDRAYAAWCDAIQTDAEEIAIVSHGVTIRMLLARLFPENFHMEQHVDIGNTSVTTIERDGDNWVITELASIAHLENKAKELAQDRGEANA